MRMHCMTQAAKQTQATCSKVTAAAVAAAPTVEEQNSIQASMQELVQSRVLYVSSK